MDQHGSAPALSGFVDATATVQRSSLSLAPRESTRPTLCLVDWRRVKTMESFIVGEVSEAQHLQLPFEWRRLCWKGIPCIHLTSFCYLVDSLMSVESSDVLFEMFSNRPGTCINYIHAIIHIISYNELKSSYDNIYISLNWSPVFERSDKIQILKTISTTSPSTPRSLALMPGMLEFVALSGAMIL